MGSIFALCQMKSYPNNVVGEQLQNAHLEQMVPVDMSRVLVIYTGGTIGMISGKDGYLPVKCYLQNKLSQNVRFHDPLPGDALKTLMNVLSPEGSLMVKGNACNPVEVDALITPYSLFHKRIRYSILEYEPLLDSSNMTMNDWVSIASDIEINYELFDAFLVLHGTDTMAYTASALSFLLENLGKTVIITGSQVPLSEVRTDAIDNLLGALTIAGHFIIPEVGLFFDNKLLRGNRSSKVNAVDFNAFDSPNLRPLVNVGININVNWETVFRPRKIAKFNAHKILNPSVASLRIFPGITSETVRAFFSPSIAGVVLETFGSGNAPSNRADLMQIIKEASDRGVVIINCSQCKVARVEAIYETGVALFNIGVVPGADMTPECALTKLTYLLGKYPNSPKRVREMMGQNLRGELTIVNRKQRFAYLPNLSHHASSQNMLVSSILSILGVANSPTQPEAELSTTNLLDGDLKSEKTEPQMGLEARLIPLAFCHAARVGDVQTLEYLISEFEASVDLSNEEGIVITIFNYRRHYMLL
jgi:60kDa lysophospholipase